MTFRKSRERFSLLKENRACFFVRLLKIKIFIIYDLKTHTQNKVSKKMTIFAGL